MQNNTPTFSLIGEELKEKTVSTVVYFYPEHYDYLNPLHKERWEKYLASLRSYPIAPGSKWEKTSGLEEGKDFVVMSGYAMKLVPGLVKKFEEIEEKERGFDIIPAQSPGEVDNLQQSVTKAANAHSYKCIPTDEVLSVNSKFVRDDVRESFVAGAEWQRSQHPDPDALAVEFGEWLNKHSWQPSGKGVWMNAALSHEYTTNRLFQIFKQQKEANK